MAMTFPVPREYTGGYRFKAFDLRGATGAEGEGTATMEVVSGDTFTAFLGSDARIDGRLRGDGTFLGTYGSTTETGYFREEPLEGTVRIDPVEITLRFSLFKNFDKTSADRYTVTVR